MKLAKKCATNTHTNERKQDYQSSDKIKLKRREAMAREDCLTRKEPGTSK
jgi:hypothetical protein